MIDPLNKLKQSAVRTVELSQPLAALTDVRDYRNVRVFVTSEGQLVGSVDIPNLGEPIGVTQLRETIVSGLAIKLLQLGTSLNANAVWTEAIAVLKRHYMPATDAEQREIGAMSLPADVSVSIVVATYDRPDDLRACLRCLVNQVSPRRVEIIVVDNNPESGLTAPVVAEFPGVQLVSERRKGLSYARNAGFAASTGEIVIATDDDVTMLSDWLEKLVAPFVRGDVMIVTGNVLPLEMETSAQQLFEAYGGLGRGFERFEVDGRWFEHFGRHAVPTWKLGATANAAFRAAIFSHPEIGLLDEALGAGSPTGCSEDTDLFYRVLKAGYTIVYEPLAYVWHRHRRELRALRNQIYSYSKGHVAYHLTTLFRDHDLRVLWQLAIELPGAHLWRIKERLLGRSLYPLSLIMLEIRGNLAGPWALWRSRRRVRRFGRSDPYIPIAQRAPAAGEPLARAHEQVSAGAL